jgi:hypothetical protein
MYLLPNPTTSKLKIKLLMHILTQKNIYIWEDFLNAIV